MYQSSDEVSQIHYLIKIAMVVISDAKLLSVEQQVISRSFEGKFVHFGRLGVRSRVTSC